MAANSQWTNFVQSVSGSTDFNGRNGRVHRLFWGPSYGGRSHSIFHQHSDGTINRLEEVAPASASARATAIIAKAIL